MNDESPQARSGAHERLLLRFRILDTDGNGYLDEADFERLAGKVLDAMGEPRESSKGQAVIDGHRRFWAGLRATLDADGDGRVGREEYLARFGDPGEAERTVADYATSVAALVDRDDDGYVERDDFIACMTASGFPASNSVTVFEELDASGDGRIPVDHWAAAIVDWYRSERTDIPGQVLVARTSDT
ncbi:EF-hand domain-containing protein [Actinoallomurus bryophytorum]|uniref:EF hand domain-containing protein n=1 Tax=Actinoallomurus bryophytorum TaxID=1490222 RepID=A0A543C0U4_9ACTN|nr:EF-hand domain-containing protein [Actinoallomurus bryophytorum]TQL90668.1 EF hand domain-containing protein [Actinoallomurus bryophytorum]